MEMAMDSTGIELRTLTGSIGVELIGIDLAKPISSIAMAKIREAWIEHTILLIRGQANLRPEDLIAFARRFGELDEHDQPQYCLAGYPEIALVSNITEGGRYIGAPRAGRHWHSDAQYLQRPPSGSLLWAKEVPSTGGNTCFANMVAAYNALDEETKRRIAGLRINFSRVRAYSLYHPERPPLSEEEKARLPDVQHPLVRTHPESLKKALYVGGEQHGGSVLGMPKAEGDVLMRDLRDFATQPSFVYEHQWHVGDAILWDNRSTMHCALPFDEERYRRLMYRVQIAGDKPC
jgi:alpha-ketoglutarate-dependent taurine dioxygenase